jgi:hypothetical protein
MPRTPKGSLPSYRLHKARGRAVVTLTDPSGERHDVLPDLLESPIARTEYLRVLGEIRPPRTQRPAANVLSLLDNVAVK